jgi:uncharacterized iron-regulated membrane protein
MVALLVILVMLVVVVIAVIGLTVWLVRRPRPPMDVSRPVDGPDRTPRQ